MLERHFPGHRASLKRQILTGALTCFNERGLEATTIETVRVYCETSVGNIYHHFGNKDGLITTLFFAALEDQARLRDRLLAAATDVESGVQALVIAYMSWVTEEPELARFLYQARQAVATGEHAERLRERNRQQTRALQQWLQTQPQTFQIERLPVQLLSALIIGPAEHFCRGWLNGRHEQTPDTAAPLLAQAACRSILSIAEEQLK